LPGGIQRKRGKGGLQLFAASADKAWFGFKFYAGIIGYRCGGPVNRLPVHTHLPRHDEPPRLLPRFRQAEGGEALV
jgi:hypothetical protein